jgi:hypothetical protein
MSVSTSENISRRETSKFDHDREIVDDSIPALDDMTVSIDVTCIADNGTTVNVGVEDSINLEENNCDDEDDDGIIESHQADSSRTGLSLKYNEKWMQRLNELRQYKEQFGDCLVPRNYEAAPGLGSWIHNQRTQYKLFKAGIHSRITPERVELLESVGFVWDAREHSLNTKSGTDDGSSQQKLSKRRRKPQDTKWLKKFEELCKYKEKYGSTLVPQSFATNPALGKWVSYQRTQYKLWKENLPSQLSQERKDLLESIGFTWLARDPDDNLPWDLRFRQLKQYKAEFGNCSVPRSYSVNPQLGAWVHYQRQQYRLMSRNKKSQMTEERVTLLEAEGFQWNVQGHLPWEARLEELKAFKAAHGNCLVPIKYPPNPQLGNWVHNQRKEHKLFHENKKSTLTHERIHLLETEGFVWDTRNTQTNAIVSDFNQHQPSFFVTNSVNIDDSLTQDASLKSNIQIDDIGQASNLLEHRFTGVKNKFDREEAQAWGV